MCVKGNLCRRQCDGLLAIELPLDERIAEMQRHAALQVGEREGLDAVAAVGDSKQREQC